jgi:FKBP-type peptidyl-prolyl cis-trans isomerase FkpA
MDAFGTFMARSPLSASLALPLFVAACAGTGTGTPPVTTTITTPSGAVYHATREGSGASPAPTDTVRVHYRGSLPDGTEFDSSHARGKPAEFALNRVIRCWGETVQLMKPGGRARLTCPPASAYGERGVSGVIPPNATLHFDVELISIVR